MLITVSKDDIEHGKKNSLCDCPIALAFKREYPNKPVMVGCPDIIAIDNRGVQDIIMPNEAIDFMAKFDAGLPVHPFCFEIPLGEKYVNDVRS